MSWSFQIRNGDLNFDGPGGFATVQGPQKLIQDLKCALLEPRGTDPVHPDYGSILNGGTMPDGSEAPSSIGQLMTPENLINVEGEIRRILHAYQVQQLDRLNRENMIYQGRNTFSAGEILLRVDDVQVNQEGDTAFCHITITTASGDAISFTQPLS